MRVESKSLELLQHQAHLIPSRTGCSQSDSSPVLSHLVQLLNHGHYRSLLFRALLVVFSQCLFLTIDFSWLFAKAQIQMLLTGNKTSQPILKAGAGKCPWSSGTFGLPSPANANIFF